MASVAEYGWGTGGIEVAERFKDSIQGKNVLITGVSPKSLGDTLAVTLAAHSPATLILASRTKSKLEAVAASIAATSPQTVPKLIVLDLSSQKAIRAAATEISHLVSHIDILINNAGVVTSTLQHTQEGIELQFGTNHIGHYLFTSLLNPLLLATPTHHSRVVNVTSLGYRCSPVRFSDYNFTCAHPLPAEEEQPASLPDMFKLDPASGKTYSPFAAYGQSKTANILHCVSLTSKYASQGLRAYAVHPGSIWTDLSRNLNEDDFGVIERTFGNPKTLDQGIGTILVAALDPALDDSGKVEGKGVFLSDCQLEDVAESAKSPALAERLWTLSEELTKGSTEG